jgi:hypothetical protein
VHASKNGAGNPSLAAKVAQIDLGAQKQYNPSYREDFCLRAGGGGSPHCFTW